MSILSLVILVKYLIIMEHNCLTQSETSYFFKVLNMCSVKYLCILCRSTFYFKFFSCIFDKYQNGLHILKENHNLWMELSIIIELWNYYPTFVNHQSNNRLIICYYYHSYEFMIAIPICNQLTKYKLST